jgi:hypothetical protein
MPLSDTEVRKSKPADRPYRLNVLALIVDDDPDVCWSLTSTTAAEGLQRRLV